MVVFFWLLNLRTIGLLLLNLGTPFVEMPIIVLLIRQIILQSLVSELMTDETARILRNHSDIIHSKLLRPQKWFNMQFSRKLFYWKRLTLSVKNSSLSYATKIIHYKGYSSWISLVSIIIFCSGLLKCDLAWSFLKFSDIFRLVNLNSMNYWTIHRSISQQSPSFLSKILQ